MINDVAAQIEDGKFKQSGLRYKVNIQNPSRTPVTVAEGVDGFELKMGDGHLEQRFLRRDRFIIQKGNKVLKFVFYYSIPPWRGVDTFARIGPAAALADAGLGKRRTDAVSRLLDFPVQLYQVVDIKLPVLLKIPVAQPDGFEVSAAPLWCRPKRYRLFSCR